ncbi:hypothetical protein FQZ97_1040800 [compost metagenome]
MPITHIWCKTMRIRRAATYSLATSLLAFIGSYCALKISYNITLFKINEEIYPTLFSMLLFVIFLFSWEHLEKISPIKSAAYGAISGYIAGIVSYLAAQVLEQDGFETMINTFSQHGVINQPFFLLIFLPALLSGSWLIGGAAFILMNRLLSRNYKVSN